MKLHLFGASGAGVTTLGQALSGTLGIPYFDTDDYFWLASDPPFTQRRPALLCNAVLERELSYHSCWILGGSLVGWGDGWLTAFELAIRTLANHRTWLSQVTCPTLEIRGDLSVQQRLALVHHKLTELERH